MKFFEGVRPSVYVQAARLRLDKKTSVRYWNLTLAITMSSKLAHACAEMIVSNYAQIATEENKCGGLDIEQDPPMQRVSIFALEEATDPALSLGNWEVTGLRLAKTEGLVELWATIEHVVTDSLHEFIKRFAFTRVWMEFVPNAAAPDPSPAAEPGGAPVADIGSLIMERVMDAMEGKVDDPALNKAIDRLRPDGKDITSVTMISGKRSVTLGPKKSKTKK